MHIPFFPVLSPPFFPPRVVFLRLPFFSEVMKENLRPVFYEFATISRLFIVGFPVLFFFFWYLSATSNLYFPLFSSPTFPARVI